MWKFGFAATSNTQTGMGPLYIDSARLNTSAENGPVGQPYLALLVAPDLISYLTDLLLKTLFKIEV